MIVNYLKNVNNHIPNIIIEYYKGSHGNAKMYQRTRVQLCLVICIMYCVGIDNSVFYNFPKIVLHPKTTNNNIVRRIMHRNSMLYSLNFQSKYVELRIGKYFKNFSNLTVYRCKRDVQCVFRNVG